VKTMVRVEFIFDEVECQKCGNVGLTSTGNCRNCYQAHKVVTHGWCPVCNQEE